MQLIMLALAAVSCYGYFRRAEKLMGLRAEFAVFVCLSALGLTMLLAAVLHLLQPAIYAVFALGLVLACYSLFRRESLRDFLQPGVIFLVLCAGAFFLLLYGSRLTHVDNFSHWGAILKMIIQRGALPGNESLVYFPAYPTGSSLLIYYFVRISGIQAEWFWAYIQGIYLASCAATLFCFVQGENIKSRLAGWAFAAVMALGLICGNIDITDLLVDSLIPMVALAGTALCIYYRENIGEKFLPLLIVSTFLPMVKNSGYLFSAVLMVFALCLSKGRGRLRLPLLMGLSLLAINRVWDWHVRRAFADGMASQHAMSAESLGSGFAEKTTEDLVAITHAFFESLLHDGRLFWLLLVLVAVLVLLHVFEKWSQLRFYYLMGILVWLLWAVGLLAMYYTSMGLGGALGMAAFERYYASSLVYCAGYFFIIAQLALNGVQRQGRKLVSALAAICCCLMLLCPNFGYLVPQKMRQPSYEYVYRCRFDSLIEQYHIPSGQSYIVFAEKGNDIIARVMCTYLLQPLTTLVCDEAGLETFSESWSNFDYYIMLDETEAFTDFVENTIGKSGPADFTY